MSDIKLGILGATGMAGREALIHHGYLNQVSENYADLTVLTGSTKSAGSKIGDVFEKKEKKLSERYSFWEERKCPEELKTKTVSETDPEQIAEKADYVISALPSEVAEKIEPELRERGVNVFSNASRFRWNEEVPLMIPEVNGSEVRELGKSPEIGVQVNNPNCTTAGFVPVLSALRQSCSLEDVSLVTMQSISGKGDRVASEEYSKRIKGNAIDDWDSGKSPNGEETKSELEPQKILGICSEKSKAREKGLPIKAQTTRIPSQYGHLETVRIRFEENIGVKKVVQGLENWEISEAARGLPTTPEKPIEVLDRQPEPGEDVYVGGGMTVTVGDIRKVGEGEISLFCLSHNLRRGATWTARQSMEAYLKYIGKI